ncbi:hypothetical protein ANOBCDAF_01289 [Pleomorphomonas sp. T1.2MG-36]|uniref:hypothetical protein n=1 Tax=Pleomorphomonas sp. T1.2MG-36 TaxID=3041167 RepID=UPI00247748F7|nr:hypothetical protein [Pleomorphomonas sp. T1.2MG-36]CAI9405692.1 hypothetical protein ANOBCDAF_01289 [Pleomorphomonas sp. T1.2MG-36]
MVFGPFRRRSPQRPAWSRLDADADDLREYDAFGPWLLQIGSAAEMPPRFRSAYDDLRHADHLIKIPRAIDRRDAFPGADLYGAAFALDSDGITLLTAPDGADGFVRRHLAWDEVAAVRTVSNLLHAEFVLLLKEGDALTVTYNSVSTDMMTRVVGFIRQQLMAPDDFGPALVNEAEEFEDFFFKAMLAEERHGGQFMLPIHFEAPGKSCRNAQNRRRVTTGLLILLSGSELVIVDRDAPMRRRFFAHYAYRKTYVGLAAVRGFRLQQPPDNAPGRFMVLELIMEQQRLGIPCFKTPQRVIDLLRRRGVARL